MQLLNLFVAISQRMRLKPHFYKKANPRIWPHVAVFK